MEGRRTITVGAACCSRYGSGPASSVTQKLLQTLRPRHVVVVGVGASLVDDGSFNIGDLGFSSTIEDISVGKEEMSPGISTSVPVTCGPDWTKVGSSVGGYEALKAALSYDQGMLTLRGVLRGNLMAEVEKLFSGTADRQAVRTLGEASRARAESLNLKVNIELRPCPESLVETAQRVADAATWQAGIHLPRPNGDGASTRALEVRVLSGPSVVKQFGMREYLQGEFPGRSLLEMEGSGAGQACHDNASDYPMVVKAACDWATPEKEKSWQPYCADVAAAFARALALELGR